MRDTDVSKVLFPVSFKPLYLYGHTKPLDNYLAIVGEFDEQDHLFSIVTPSYSLITNNEAIEIGITAFQRLFNASKQSDFQVFNLNYPKTRSTATIDIIHKEYKVNVWQNEVYVPYFRVTNSYNKTRALSFDIGFCRKLCDNGVIFEKDLVKVKIFHLKKNFDKDKLFGALSSDRLSQYVEDFKKHLNKIKNFEIKKRYFIPLIAKALKFNFDTNTKDKKRRDVALKNLGLFISQILPLASKYHKEFGSTAYAVYNIITDYSSNISENDENYLTRRISLNRNQKLCGEWLKNFNDDISKTNNNYDEYLKEYREFYHYSFN